MPTAADQRSRRDDARRAMDSLRRIVRALSSSARLAGRSSTSGAQAFVLHQLVATPGLSIRELAHRTFARQSTVSEVVARLVASRLVARRASASDARRVELTLTPRGRRMAQRVPPTAQEQLAAGLARLPAARRRSLALGIEAWLAAADLTAVPATMFFEHGTDG